MSYEPRLQRNAQKKITEYLEAQYLNREPYLLAVEQVRLALLRLAASPKQAVAPPGPFETRPIFRFTLNPDGTPRDVQVCFCFDHADQGERVILITDFMSVP